jgi:hypothetical protein
MHTNSYTGPRLSREAQIEPPLFESEREWAFRIQAYIVFKRTTVYQYPSVSLFERIYCSWRIFVDGNFDCKFCTFHLPGVFVSTPSNLNTISIAILMLVWDKRVLLVFFWFFSQNVQKSQQALYLVKNRSLIQVCKLRMLAHDGMCIYIITLRIQTLSLIESHDLLEDRHTELRHTKPYPIAFPYLHRWCTRFDFFKFPNVWGG